MIRAQSRTRAIVALWIAVLIWASTFAVTKNVVSTIGPGLLTTARFAIASAVLVTACYQRRIPVKRLLTRSSAVCGLTGVALYYGLQNIGLQSVSAATGALLQATLPVACTLLAFLLLRDRLGVREVAGTCLSVVGVVTIFGSETAAPGTGEVAIILGVVAYAVYTVYLRSSAATSGPLELSAGSALFGTAFVAPWAVWEVLVDGPPSITVANIWAVGYLGTVASALTLLLWTYGVGRAGAATAGTFAGAIPAVGYLLALADGEPFAWVKLAGSGLALMGVAIASSTGADHPS